MKMSFYIACLLLSACLQPRAPAATITAPPPDDQILAIQHVTVVDVLNGSLRAKHTVLIAGNRITNVAPDDQVRVPDRARGIDATGRYGMPGRWDMHVHSVANIAVDRSIESVPALEWHFSLFLAHGVTGVRNMNDG